MSSPKDITHCFAFDKVISARTQARRRNFFFKLTYVLLGILFIAQLVFFLI